MPDPLPPPTDYVLVERRRAAALEAVAAAARRFRDRQDVTNWWQLRMALAALETAERSEG